MKLNSEYGLVSIVLFSVSPGTDNARIPLGNQ